MLRNILNKLKSHFDTVLAVSLIVSLYFSARKVLVPDYSYFLGEWKDFTTIFLYISDIIIFCLLLSTIIKIRKGATKKFYHVVGSGLDVPKLCLMLLAALPPLALAGNFYKLPELTISIYYLLLVTKGFVLHETFRGRAKEFFGAILGAVLALTIFQGLLALFQFAFQSNIGFHVVGEPIFSPYGWGVAKVESLGLAFVRPYGTFPHPNVLAAFLGFGLLVNLYYLYKAGSRFKFLTLLFCTLLNITAVLLTLSRSVWFALLVAVPMFHVFTWNIIKDRFWKVLLSFGSCLLTIVLVGVVLLPLIQQRGNVFDRAYRERESYNTVGLEMVAGSPVIGQGPSGSVLHMEQYLGYVWPWEV